MLKGSQKPKGKNTYQAEDGLYYDPSQLESYFIKPLSPGFAALKELYSDDYLKDLVYQDNPFLKLCKNQKAP